MPQLDIVYTLLMFTWTWIILVFISQKVGSYLLYNKPQNQTAHKNPTKHLPLLWT